MRRVGILFVAMALVGVAAPANAQVAAPIHVPDARDPVAALLVVSNLLESAVPVTGNPSVDREVQRITAALGLVRDVVVSAAPGTQIPETGPAVEQVSDEAETLVEEAADPPRPIDERFTFDGHCTLRNVTISPNYLVYPLTASYTLAGAAACDGVLAIGNEQMELHGGWSEFPIEIKTGSANLQCNGTNARGKLDFGMTQNGSPILFSLNGQNLRPTIEFAATIVFPGQGQVTLALNGANGTAATGALTTSNGGCANNTTTIAPSGHLQTVARPLESTAAPERW